MVTETKEVAIVHESKILAIPDETAFRSQMQAIVKFQQLVQATLISKLDYGVIPGTDKPTLLKPGAEKIIKLLGLSDEYEIVDRQEDWSKPFFRYLIRCKLYSMQNGILISSGLGECNSYESKYRYRWLFQSQLPSPYLGDENKPRRDQLVSREVKTKNGKAKQYRMENEDIFSQVNTILKMSKKRAMIDAALSAGRLSNIFTQDIEDLPQFADAAEDPAAPEEETVDHAPMGICPVHRKPFVEGQYGWYCKSKDPDTGKWCKEKPKPQPIATPEQVEKDSNELFADQGSSLNPAPEADKSSLEQTTEPVYPPPHDESLISNDQCIELDRLMKERSVSGQAIGIQIKKNNWLSVQKMGELKVWQFEELKKYLNTLPVKK